MRLRSNVNAQATDNHDRTTKTSATLVFDLAFVFKTGKSVPTSGLKNFWDKNGLFYWLGTKGGTTQAWANPWRLGSVCDSKSMHICTHARVDVLQLQLMVSGWTLTKLPRASPPASRAHVVRTYACATQGSQHQRSR